ncbi:aminotransferase-like domain-containing protein [Roseitranquillus sediminis]|uniref:aminotransferase-like domain-containing protein n=1 Tax=Roseitranquillus sediminis TaxID=2809051 RepID=UPI001D0CA088|nr:PLP-dependent aminotransferase family protein [Roseitranquillus sediminis]MBM9594933.1 PLP-dependent aminotransferase family protein [Roseitranquillus sediminis]
MKIEAEWLARRLRGRDAKGIAVETARLVRSGELPVGSRLPALRDLAFHTGISPATISGAWTALRRQKVLTGRGRNGTWVTETAIGNAPARTGRMGAYGPGALDLSLAVPDPALLPPLEAALRHAATGPDLNSYRRSRIEPSLRDAVEPTWPYPPNALLATNGGYNAVYAAVHALVTPGDAVACEEPTAIRLLDILEDAGAHILPVACDDRGPLPEALDGALAQRPVLFLYQPRTHSVTGRHVDAARIAELGDSLKDQATLVLEDDGLGDVSAHPSQSLGARFPERVIHIRSLSKSYGPDLRLAVMSAPEDVVERVQSYRLFSAGWTSRLLQNAAAWLLSDPETAARLDEARSIYAARRSALLDALETRGMAAFRGDGLCLWLPVPSEPFALVTLAAHGIVVLPGEKCFLHGAGHIRVGTSMLADGYERVADALLLASRPHG